MDHLGAEFGELGPDIRLRDQNPGADGAEALQRAEIRHQHRRGGPLQRLDPVRDLAPELFDLFFLFDYFRIVLHGPLPDDISR